MNPLPPGPGKKPQAPKRDDAKAAIERFRAAVRDTCPPALQAKIFMALDQLEQGALAGRLGSDGMKSGLQQVRANTRRNLRETPTDMVRVLKALDGMEDDVVKFLESLEAGGQG